jgi:hypothetical protein
VTRLPVKMSLISVLAEDVDVLYVLTLEKTSSFQILTPNSACSGETLYLGLIDQMMATLGVTLPYEGIVLDQVLTKMV